MMNEEELKANVILPLLNDLGFGPNDLSLEHYIKIRLPRGEVDITSSGEDVLKKGFADFVCRSTEGKNLFIIEAKSPGKPLTEKDRDQGIVYARLLPGNMAPIVIVTNGNKTILYDTYTEEEINQNSLDFRALLEGRRCPTTDEIALRVEALEHFIGMNLTNLVLFCESQHKSYLSNLEGPINQGRKYSPELFIPREGILNHVNSFLKSESPFMPIIGEANIGKTNVMCDLAKRLMNQGHLTFFYNAAQMCHPLEKSIKNDFDWFFSASQSLPQRFYQLARVLDNNKKVIILVDAIDEWKMSDAPYHLNDFVNKTSSLKGAVKVISTCKPIDWATFRTIGGSVSHLDSLAYKDHNDNNIITISQFKEDEAQAAFANYKRTYNFKGNPSHSLQKQLSNPNNLRLLALVYSEDQLPYDINEKDLLRAYLDQEKETCPELREVLKIVAQLIIEEDNPQVQLDTVVKSRLAVKENKLKEKLGMSALMSLPDCLFSRNLLARIPDEHGEQFIAFYHEGVKNYVIAFWTLKFHEKTSQVLESELPIWMKSTFIRDAIKWYTKYANKQFIKVMKHYNNEKAKLFLDALLFLINITSPHLTEQLLSEGEGEIGILYSGGIESDFICFGFRRLEATNNENVLLMDHAPHPFGQNDHNVEWHRNGAHSITGRSVNFTTMDPDKFAIDYYLERLKEVLENGQIEWFNNVFLCRETIYSILSYSYSRFKEILPRKEPKDVDPCERLEPIPLNLIDKVIDYHFAIEYFEEQCHQDKIKKGDYESDGKFMMMNFSGEEFEPYYKKALEHVEAGKERLYIHIDRSFPIRTLIRCVEYLRSKGINEVTHPLPRPNEMKLVKGGPYHELERYEHDELKKYLEQLITLTAECYQTIAENNFPGLAGILYHPDGCKMDLFLHIDRYPIQERPGYNYQVIFRETKSKESQKHKIIVTVYPEKPSFSPYEKEIHSITHFKGSLNGLFSAYDENPSYDGHSSYKYGELAVIRYQIHKRLNNIFRDKREKIYEALTGFMSNFQN